MPEDIAYKSTSPEVLSAWETYLQKREEVRLKRNALADAVGRSLYVNRKGFGPSTRVTAFERFDSDKDGDTLHHDKSLIVSSSRGPRNGLVVPNLRRKSGKEFARELSDYDEPDHDLPGCPTFHIGSDGFGIRSYSPAVFAHNGTVYALWGVAGPMDPKFWTLIPLSEFYYAHESHTVQKIEGR